MTTHRPPHGSLFAVTDGHRDGETYDAMLDGRRLNAQQKRVYYAMADGCWRTLRAIADETGDAEASVSARLRDFRKSRFGGYRVDRRRRDGGGLYEYRLLVNDEGGE